MSSEYIAKQERRLVESKTEKRQLASNIRTFYNSTTNVISEESRGVESATLSLHAMEHKLNINVRNNTEAKMSWAGTLLSTALVEIFIFALLYVI
mmetsp:Transcript_6921/g.10127  ORF Transcript_6921/g.10127 Transcript_6921/m.10127 type:complete len:95 (-) Transcript_6921:74-358(-)